MILKIILRIIMIMPAIIIIKPLIVQEGLLYINELAGPNIALDCAVKIKPTNTSAIPIISINIFIYYQINIEICICICCWHFDYFIYIVGNLMFGTEIKTKYRFLINQQLDWIECKRYTIWLSFKSYKVAVMSARIKIDWK